MSKTKIISPEKLYYTEFETENIFVMRQKWVKGAVFRRAQPRKSTGLIFLNSVRATYIGKSGKAFDMNKKGVVCLPEGSEYTCINRECTGTLNDAVLLEINIKEDGEPLTFSNEPFEISDINILLAEKYFEEIIRAYKSAKPSPLAVRTAVYSLLHFICKEKSEKLKDRFSQIRSGIECIEHDTLCTFSIEEIASACNVSSSYFRRLFKEYSGKSPNEHRLDVRLNMAKKMLESSGATLEYIAEALNFQSPSYFCRIFKKKFGITPGEYRTVK